MANVSSSIAPLIVIEGIDGSGKGTQAKRLHEILTQQGHRCGLLSFPQYDDNFFGARIGDFLNGEFGDLGDLDPFLISLLYAGDRFESREKILAAQAESELLILDRYVPSNLAHQAAKYHGTQRAQLIEWIEKIEYEIFKVPRPSQVILLDTPVETSQNLIARKSQRTYTDQKADLQESDTTYLSEVRNVYLEVAQSQPKWTVVPVVLDGHLRTIDEIGDDILGIAQNLL